MDALDAGAHVLTGSRSWPPPWRLADGIEHESGTRSTFFATNAHHTNADVDVEISCRDGVVALCGGKVLLSDADGSRAIARDSQSHG